MNKTQIDFISEFISVESANNKFCSTFAMALRDARLITGRDLASGACHHYILMNSKKEHLKPYSPIGLLNYLILLEMIGKIFNKSRNSDGNKGIKSALRDFSDLDKREIDTINDLRNALAHSYSLTNIPDKQKHYQNSRHLFAFHITGDFPLIQYPETNWNGDYNQTESRTWIQINNLFNIIESIIKFISNNLENEQINIRMEMDELKTRYFINF